jgi:hypothetical protein
MNQIWICHLTHAFLAEVSTLRSTPIVIEFIQDRSEQSDDRWSVREDTYQFGPAFDLLVDPFQ